MSISSKNINDPLSNTILNNIDNSRINNSYKNSNQNQEIVNNKNLFNNNIDNSSILKENENLNKLNDIRNQQKVNLDYIVKFIEKQISKYFGEISVEFAAIEKPLTIDPTQSFQVGSKVYSGEEIALNVLANIYLDLQAIEKEKGEDVDPDAYVKRVSRVMTGSYPDMDETMRKDFLATFEQKMIEMFGQDAPIIKQKLNKEIDENEIINDLLNNKYTPPNTGINEIVNDLNDN